MNTILNQYEVQFSTPLNYPKYNKITTISSVLSQVIGDSYLILDANDIFDAINIVLNDPDINKTIFYYTRSIQIVIITKAVVKLYEDEEAYDVDSNMTPTFSLPTADFKIIVEAWRDYVVQSPASR